MKKTLTAYLFAHLTLCALGGVLLAGALLLQPGYALSPLWTLAAAPMAYAAWLLGRKHRGAELSADMCWNCAMAEYALSLALFFWLWRSRAILAAAFNVWNFPCAPFLAGLDALVGHIHVDAQFDYDLFYRSEIYQNTVLPILAAVAAAVEPLCFTLGLVGRSKKTADEEKN